jgi:hypothetical protein
LIPFDSFWFLLIPFDSCWFESKRFLVLEKVYINVGQPIRSQGPHLSKKDKKFKIKNNYNDFILFFVKFAVCRGCRRAPYERFFWATGLAVADLHTYIFLESDGKINQTWNSKSNNIIYMSHSFSKFPQKTNMIISSNSANKFFLLIHWKKTHWNLEDLNTVRKRFFLDSDWNHFSDFHWCIKINR